MRISDWSSDVCSSDLQPRGEEIGKRRFDFPKPLQVGDVAAAFDRENEVVRRLGAPAPKAVRPLQRVKGAVDLDRVELTAGIIQFATLRQTLRIEYAPPGRSEESRVGKECVSTGRCGG